MRIARASAALLLAVALAPGHAAMYRCDGGLVTDRAIAGKGCVQLGASSVPKTDPAPAAGPATGSANSGASERMNPNSAVPQAEAVKPYVRPAPVPYTPPPPPDLSALESALPKDEQGRPILYQSGGAALVLEKQKSKRPVNVLAACSGLVSGCVKKDVRSLDQCFVSVPQCQSADGIGDERPCCPSACQPRYEELRKSGKGELGAFDVALFGDPSCISGLKGKPIDEPAE